MNRPWQRGWRSTPPWLWTRPRRRAVHLREAISLLINCADQDEVDDYWTKLADGGEEEPCGWRKGRYGLSWRVCPVGMGEMLNDPDQARVQRAMRAMLGLKKIDIATLYAAADQA
jgi:predicted 3-demethylubiquinone-9 3-methyltransferase (glyoxalase superfamily)